MNGRPIGHEQPHGLHPWLTTRFLCAALACLALVLALFLAPAQTGFAQGGSVVCTALTMTPGTLPGSVMGASYSQTFHTTQNWGCCATLPFVYSKYSGSLPAGLTLTTAGVLSGTTVTPGSYTFILRSEDSGSKPNGYWCQGQYTIVVSGSNHAPTFAAGPDVTVLEDAPAYSADWASNMSPGGTQDANQTLTFKVTNDNNALFSVQPAISATDGKLSFTLKPNGNGVANVVVYLTDNGGTANGGSDTGAQTNFKITVTPVEDPQTGPTYTVNSTAWMTDSMCGEMNCTLREAIDAANSDGQDSTIELAPGAIYTLQGDVGGSAGLPSITSAMTINGHGAIIEPSTTSGMPVIRMLSVPSGGNLTLNEVEVRDFKLASPLMGGALYVEGNLTVKNSTLHDNSSKRGGAIYKTIGMVTLVNSTFYRNAAEDYGGVIYNPANGLTILSSTFADNTGAQDLGAAYWSAGAPTVIRNNLLLKGTSSGVCGWVKALASNGNMSDDSTCSAMTKTADEIKLQPLASNGGPTPTMALVAGSAAIDVGNTTGCQDPNIGGRDQRRFNRVSDGNGDGVAQCDVGAYEYGATELPPTSEPPDADPPVVTILLTPARSDGANEWYRGPVTVKSEVSDASPFKLRCALDPVTAPQTYGDLPANPCPFFEGGDGMPVTADGHHAFYAAAKDLHGNESQVVSVAFKIDATPPLLTCPLAGPFLLHTGGHAIGPVGVDSAISGLDGAASTLSGTIATDGIGPETLMFKALDLAGNATTDGCIYYVIYDFGGPYPPVKPAPALNGANAGSAIPFKFSLAGDQGLGVIAQGYPTSQPVACDTYEPAGSAQATKLADKNGLSYDPGNGWYGYAWKTDKAWAGTCRALKIKLIDDTEHQAYFQFK